MYNDDRQVSFPAHRDRVGRVRSRHRVIQGEVVGAGTAGARYFDELIILRVRDVHRRHIRDRYYHDLAFRGAPEEARRRLLWPAVAGAD